jgi:hypothetical protein
MVRNGIPTSTALLLQLMEGVAHSVMDHCTDCMLVPMKGNKWGHFILFHQQHGHILYCVEWQFTESRAAQVDLKIQMLGTFYEPYILDSTFLIFTFDIVISCTVELSIPCQQLLAVLPPPHPLQMVFLLATGVLFQTPF